MQPRASGAQGAWGMKSVTYIEYPRADAFLAVMQGVLEQNEVVNGLMLGIALRLKEDLFRYGSQPLLATIARADALVLTALMTPPYKLQLMSPRPVSDEVIELLAEKLREGDWPVPAVIAERQLAERFAEEWTTRTGVGVHEGMRQRMYELREVVQPTDPGGEPRQATSDDQELARTWACSFYRDCFHPGEPDRTAEHVEAILDSDGLWFWVVSDQPVSMAGRTRPTPHGEAIGYVYTPPEHRRHGYATALVAHLSQVLLDEGKHFCTLFTDLSNPTSNSIYQKIGYRPVADVVDLLFAKEQVSR